MMPKLPDGAINPIVVVECNGLDVRELTLPALPSHEVIHALPSNEDEMRQQALYVALQPSFLEDVDQCVGEPRAGETQDQFVERAKTVLISKLRAILEDGSVEKLCEPSAANALPPPCSTPESN